MYMIKETHYKQGEINMGIKKGEIYKTTYSDKLYVVAGRWGRDVILSPIEAEDEECMVYSETEIKNLLKEGKFSKEKRCTL